MGKKKSTIATRLRELRQKAGLTQSDLAVQAGVAPSTLAKIEQGETTAPSTSVLLKLAAALGYELDVLLGYTPSKIKPALRPGKTKIKFIYFDVGRVLVHIDPALQAFAVRIGRPLDQVKALFYTYAPLAYTGKLSLYDLQLMFVMKLKLDYSKDNQPQIFANWVDDMTPIKVSHEFLREVAQHYPLGLLTNTINGFVERMMRQELVPDIAYRAVIKSCEKVVVKPEREIFAIATEEAGVEPGDILFIDDAQQNVQAASDYGWQAEWFDELHPHESIERIRNKYFS